MQIRILTRFWINLATTGQNPGATGSLPLCLKGFGHAFVTKQLLALCSSSNRSSEGSNAQVKGDGWF